MTESDLAAIKEMTPERATIDLISYVEDILMEGNSRLDDEECTAISTKVHFWWHAARIQGGNAAFEKIKENLARFMAYDAIYTPRRAGELSAMTSLAHYPQPGIEFGKGPNTPAGREAAWFGTIQDGWRDPCYGRYWRVPYDLDRYDKMREPERGIFQL